MSQTPLDPAGLSWQPCLGRTKDEAKQREAEEKMRTSPFCSHQQTAEKPSCFLLPKKPAIAERFFSGCFSIFFNEKADRGRSLQIAPHPLTLWLPEHRRLKRMKSSFEVGGPPSWKVEPSWSSQRAAGSAVETPNTAGGENHRLLLWHKAGAVNGIVEATVLC